MTRTRIVGGFINKVSKGKTTFLVTHGSFTSMAARSNIWQGKEGIVERDYEGKKKEEKNVCTCKVSKKATSFKSLVELVKQAEEMLIANGQDEMGIRINTIRGIYYGTTWSLDYAVEKSTARIKGFNFFAGCKVVNDARSTLKCSKDCKANLFESLYESFEIYDDHAKAIDFGHLVIGLDSRRNSLNRYLRSGLEKNTWVGDLGGGTGALSNQRLATKNKRAKTVFEGKHSYGAVANLEGDIAGYVVGMDEKKPSDVVNPSDNFNSIHEALEDYFNRKWQKRAFYFLTMLGAKVFENKIVYVKNDLIGECAGKLESFALQYLAVRMADKNNNNIDALTKSSNSFRTVSSELASIFIDALIHVVKNPQDSIIPRTDPDPGKPEETPLYKMHKRSGELYKESIRKSDEIYKQVESKFKKMKPR